MDIVQVLLAHGPIPEIERERAELRAHMMGRSDIEKILRQSRPPAIIHVDQFEEVPEVEAAEQPSCPSVTRGAIIAAGSSIAVGIAAWCIQQYVQAQFFEE